MDRFRYQTKFNMKMNKHPNFLLIMITCEFLKNLLIITCTSSIHKRESTSMPIRAETK